MTESQIAQLVDVVPLTDKGKISRQPKDLETANLIDFTMQHTTIYNHRWEGG